MHDRPMILVVEDDVELNALERQLLELHGLDSVPAYSGTEALARFKESHADAVLLDLMLPEMDGFETCRHLRADGNGYRVPIIMVTALDNERDRRRGLQLGADAYYTKPFDPETVIAALRDLIGKAQHLMDAPHQPGSDAPS